MNQLNFCGGLPRTGSTVLMNILQQNPDVFTTSSDPFPNILNKHILIDTRYSENFQAMSTTQADQAVHGMALGATRGWYEGLTSKPVVISKARSWSHVHHLFPDAKILVTVRDLRDIVESFDKINRNIKALHSYAEDGKLYGCMLEEEKYTYHFETNNALSGTLYGELRKYMTMFQRGERKIKFIRYEDFLKEPNTVLNNVYRFLELPSFNHDLDNISQSELFEHDNAYFREKTSHVVQSQMIPWKEPQRHLSDWIHNKIIEDHKWYYEAFYPEVL